jgi:hypothetical protein
METIPSSSLVSQVLNPSHRPPILIDKITKKSSLKKVPKVESKISNGTL